MSHFETSPTPGGLPDLPAPANGSPIPPSVTPLPLAPGPDERTMAMLAELLQLFSWIIGPLIIFLVKRDSPFVRFHALQAILWQLVMMMFSIILFVVAIAVIFAAPKSANNMPAAPVLFMLSFYSLFGLFSLANFVIAIYFAVKANGGAWASYPVIGRIAHSILGV